MDWLKYKLEIVVFITGAVVMVFEIVGSRVVAPFFGSSLFTWTSLIGIILASLSLGYYLGGRLADRKPSAARLAWIILAASAALFSVTLANRTVLHFAQWLFDDIRYSSLFGITLLFFTPGFFLGMVAPYAVKLDLRNLSETGRIAGRLYAVSTIGSILGTFLAGFYLIPALGTQRILLLLGFVLWVPALLMHPGIVKLSKNRSNLLIIAGIALFSLYYVLYDHGGAVDIDTPYSRVLIYERLDTTTQKPVTEIRQDIMSSAAMDQEDPTRLVYPVMQFFRLGACWVPQVNHALLIGGSAFSFPRHYLAEYPAATLDVVEIDPRLVDITRHYFELPATSRMKIIHQDGRTFINRAPAGQYDLIYMDAFHGYYAIPFQLVTEEAAAEYARLLKPDGALVMNSIASLQHIENGFLGIALRTLKHHFSSIEIYPVSSKENMKLFQNVVIIASLNNEREWYCADPDLEEMRAQEFNIPNQVWKGDKIFTDNYAPVEYLVAQSAVP